MTHPAARYLAMMQDFASGRCNASEFETTYSAAYLGDDEMWDQELFDLLDGVFAATDEHDEDPDYRATNDMSMSGEQLRDYVRAKAAELSTLLDSRT